MTTAITGDARYNLNLPKWELIRLLASGDILNRSAWMGKLYYPGKNCTSVIPSNVAKLDERQRDFIDGATLLPAVGLTKTGSVGAVFRKPTDIVLSSQLDYLLKNCDGSGKTAEQVIQEGVSENVSIGYGGFFTDFAPGDFTGSQAEAVEAGRVATISVYQAESILRIGIRKVGNINMVWSIVLCETAVQATDALNEETVKQYRVLTYDESGNYIQRVYKDEGASGINDVYEEFMPLADGQPMKTIPFEFFGSQSNDYKVDDAPLYPMATMNGKHVELSAIRNESIRKLGPTMFAEVPEGFDFNTWKEAYPDGLEMSANKSYWGMKGNIVQADPNDAALSDMTRIKEDILNAGALLITPQVSGLSTETVTIQKSNETAVLGVVVRNTESAFNLSLEHAQAFMGGTGDSMVDINRDFINTPFTAESRKQWAADVLGGNVTLEEYRIQLEKHGLIAEAEALEPLPEPDNLDGDDDQ